MMVSVCNLAKVVCRLLSRKKLEVYLLGFTDDGSDSLEVERFVQDLLIKIEFGHFEVDDEEDLDPYL